MESGVTGERGQVLKCQFFLRNPGTDNLGVSQARLTARFHLDFNQAPVNGDKCLSLLKMRPVC